MDLSWLIPHYCAMPKRKVVAFTLIELLVVIAIIAILFVYLGASIPAGSGAESTNSSPLASPVRLRVARRAITLTNKSALSPRSGPCHPLVIRPRDAKLL